jgi:hypothetical protein
MIPSFHVNASAVEQPQRRILERPWSLPAKSPTSHPDPAALWGPGSSVSSKLPALTHNTKIGGRDGANLNHNQQKQHVSPTNQLRFMLRQV